MSKREAGRELFAALQEAGQLEFGSEILATEVQAILGLEVPATATREVFNALAMAELAAVDYVRNVLLGQGKYLAGTRAGYRVLLPSENAQQIEHYMASADRKLNRALKLSRNTPAEAGHRADQTEARIAMKRSSQRRFGEPARTAA